MFCFGRPSCIAPPGANSASVFCLGLWLETMMLRPSWRLSWTFPPSMFLFPIILQSLYPASFAEIGVGVSPLLGLGRMRKICSAPSICKTSMSPTGNRWSLLTIPSILTLPVFMIRIASLDVLANPRISRMIITSGRLFSLE